MKGKIELNRAEYAYVYIFIFIGLRPCRRPLGDNAHQFPCKYVLIQDLGHSFHSPKYELTNFNGEPGHVPGFLKNVLFSEIMKNQVFFPKCPPWSKNNDFDVAMAWDFVPRVNYLSRPKNQ